MEEKGWLIEIPEGPQAGYFSGSILFPTTDPNKAVRFCREEDADRVRNCLLAGEMAASALVHSRPETRKRTSERWTRSRVAEHMWLDCVDSEDPK